MFVTVTNGAPLAGQSCLMGVTWGDRWGAGQSHVCTSWSGAARVCCPGLPYLALNGQAQRSLLHRQCACRSAVHVGWCSAMRCIWLAGAGISALVEGQAAQVVTLTSSINHITRCTVLLAVLAGAHMLCYVLYDMLCDDNMCPHVMLCVVLLPVLWPAGDASGAQGCSAC